MPNFAANLSFLFTELPFLDRFAAARRAGFRGVEFLFPYEHDAREIERRLGDEGLQQVLFNVPPGDWAAGERGFAAVPGREAAFASSLAKAIDFAGRLSCPRLHIMAGIVGPQHDPAACLGAFRANLHRAAEACAAAGIVGTIEPINRRDIPGYFLSSFALARQMIREVASPHLRLQHDFYHAQIIEGDLSRGFAANLPHVAHIQIANPPDRSEPDAGEIAYTHVFDLIDRSGYDGWVGCEYRPRAGTLEGLGWAKPYGIGA